MRPNRIKEVRFNSFTVNGSLVTETYTNQSINGEVLKIVVNNITSPGSLWLGESGISTELFRKNNFASGDSTFVAYPFVYTVNNTNTTGSPQSFTNYVTNGPLYIAGSGFTSGTSKTFGPITVYYR